MAFHRGIMELAKLAEEDKKVLPVKMGEMMVANADNAFELTFGPCSSVVLVGEDSEGMVWFGINHMLRSRHQNTDIALKEVSTLRNDLLAKGIETVSCLGIFGGGYRDGSVTKAVAQKNIETILEALSLFYLPIEMFETGYEQKITILYSEKRSSFLIKRLNTETGETKVSIIPEDKILHR